MCVISSPHAAISWDVVCLLNLDGTIGSSDFTALFLTLISFLFAVGRTQTEHKSTPVTSDLLYQHHSYSTGQRVPHRTDDDHEEDTKGTEGRNVEQPAGGMKTSG